MSDIAIGKVFYWIINMIYLISVFAFILDFLTKWWAVSSLEYGVPTPVFPCFNLFLVGNRGISFSFLSAKDATGIWLLIALALAICAFLIYLIQHEKDKFSRIALAMVLGGALGNVFDRLRYGFVIDFLDFYWDKHHFPAFNLADSFICIGVGLLLLKMMKKEKKNA